MIFQGLHTSVEEALNHLDRLCFVFRVHVTVLVPSWLSRTLNSAT